MSWKRLLGLIVALLVASAPALCEPRLKKIAPDTVSILLDQGSGSTTVLLGFAANQEAPQVEVTAAVGPGGTIPATSVSWNWQGAPIKSANQTYPKAILRVQTSGYVEPGVEYKGKVLFLWKDHDEGFDYVVRERAVAELQLTPEKLEVSLGPLDPRSVHVRVRNAGKTEIRTLQGSSLGLSDSTRRRRTEPIKTNEWKGTLSPGHETELSIPLPQPTAAGNYTGQLEVKGNGISYKALTLEVQTRGPNRLPFLSAYSPWLPCVLFGLVLLGGFLLATLLEDWFGEGGGLQRAAALVLLKESRSVLEGKAEELKSWSDAHDPREELRRASTLVQVNLEELRTIFDGKPVSELSELATRVAKDRSFLDALWIMVEVAGRQWAGQPNRLRGVLGSLDQVQAADLAAYRAALSKALVDQAGDAERASVAQGVDGARPGKPAEAEAGLRRQIQRMGMLRRAAVWVIVGLFAYQSFYASQGAFGTLQDYVSVFLWTLGLTPTGTKILAMAPSARGSR